MQSDPPGSASEEFSVRLSWPEASAEADPEPEAEPSPAAAPAAEAPSTERTTRRLPGTVRTKLRTATVRTGAAVPAADPPPVAPSPAPAGATDRPRPATTRRPAAPTGSGTAPGSTSALSAASEAASASIGASLAGASGAAATRPFVEAFDRLADRLLDRLRVLRQDIDGDLTALRAEVGSLRQAVDQSSQSTQIRQLQMGLDEARSEVASLRRAVLEWPELERVSDEVSSMRGELSLLLESGEGPGGPASFVGELRDVLDQVSEQLGARRTGAGGDPLAWLVDEVASVRSELADLARRSSEPARLDPEDLSRIVEAVSARVLDELDARTRRPKRR